MKFRIKNKDSFEKGEYFLSSSGELFQEDKMDGILLHVDQSDKIVQFSTGLTDIDGVEIFEGDFIEWEVNSGSVYSGEVGLSKTSAAFIIDTSGRHLIGDTKYGDFCFMHKEHGYKIIKQ